MNNHLKLLLYIGMIVGIFVLVQNKFNLFDVTLIDRNDNQLIETIPDNEKDSQDISAYVEISIPNGFRIKVNVEIADNDIKRAQGLSNRRYLGDYDGMLFLFDENVNNPFWMKDTLIPLDMIFVDEQGYIVDIKSNQQPCNLNSCPHIYSSSFYRYVLEVNGNFCQENGIEVGYSMIQYL